MNAHPTVQPWKILLVTGLAIFSAYLLQSAIAPVLDLLIADFEVNFTTAGLLVSAYFFSYAASQIPSGILADLFRPGRILTVALLALISGSLIFISTQNLWLALASRILMGLGAGLIFPPAIRLIVQWFRGRGVGRALGAFASCAFLGSFAANIAIPLLTSALQGWRPSYLAVALPTLAIPLVTWFTLGRLPRNRIGDEDSMPVDGQKGSGVGLSTILRSALSKRRAWAVYLVQMTYFGGFFGVLTWMPLYLLSKGLDHVSAGFITSLAPLGAVLGLVLTGWASDRWKRRRLLLTLFLPVFAGLVAVLAVLPEYVVEGRLLVVPLSFALGFFWSGNVINLQQIADIFPTAQVGTAIGVMNTFSWVGSTAYPAIIGFVLDATQSYSVGFGLLVLAEAVTLILVRLTPEAPPSRS